MPNTEPNVYSSLNFPVLSDRPYVVIDMVATIDGRTVSGDRDEDVIDLGSKLDHLVMRQLGEQCDAVLIGAQTLRTASPKWNPPTRKRVVLTHSGNLNYDSEFVRGGELIIGASSQIMPKAGVVEPLTSLPEFVGNLKQNHGINKLLVLGGSTVNGQFITADLADELFLTIAPKIKLGHNLPSYAEGDPFSRERMPSFRLVECHPVENEVFLRYQRSRRA